LKGGQLLVKNNIKGATSAEVCLWVYLAERHNIQTPESLKLITFPGFLQEFGRF
jgi:hypothetical protein